MQVAWPIPRLWTLPKLSVPLPPAEHQRKIALAILSATDDLIDNNNRRIAILERDGAATLSRMVLFISVSQGMNRCRWWSRSWELIQRVGHGLRWQCRCSQAVLSNRLISRARRQVHRSRTHAKALTTLSEWGRADEALQVRSCNSKLAKILFGKIRPYFHKVGVAPVDGVCSGVILSLFDHQRRWMALHSVASQAMLWSNMHPKRPRHKRCQLFDWNLFVRYPLASPQNRKVWFSETVGAVVDLLLIYKCFKNIVPGQVAIFYCPIFCLANGTLDNINLA